MGRDRGRRVAAQLLGCGDQDRRSGLTTPNGSRPSIARASRPRRARGTQRGGDRETFVNSDPQPALSSGAGARVAATSLALTGLPVAEYAANLIEETVVGVGHAENATVAMMVGSPARLDPRDDAGRGRRPRGRHLPRPASSGAGAQGAPRSTSPGRRRRSVDEEALILDVNGVGYLLSASARTLRAPPAPEKPAELLIETHVREDAIRPHGFLTATERDWFRLLQGVQGRSRWPSEFSALPPETLSAATARQDKTTMARAPGVGEARRPPGARTQGQGAGVRRRRFRWGGGPHERTPKLTRAAEDAILDLVGLGLRPPPSRADRQDHRP